MSETQGFRCSPQQRRLFVDGRGAAACVQGVVTLQGTLREDALRGALEDVVARHDILRMTFHRVPGMAWPVQSVAEEARLAWRTVPVASHGSEAKQLEDVAREERAREIPPSEGPVLRAALVARGGARHSLVLTLPAPCADRRTLELLMRETGRAYEARVTRLLADDAEVLSYLQYADLQNELEEQQDEDPRKDFWRQDRARRATPPRLPFRGMPSTGAELARVTEVVLQGRDAVAALDGVSARHGASPEAFLLACWQSLLARLTETQDVVVACAFDGRCYEETESALGAFGRWLPVAARVTAQRPLRELAADNARLLETLTDAQEAFPESDTLDEAWRAVGFEAFTWPEPLTAAGLGLSLEGFTPARDRCELKLVCARRPEGLVAEVHHDASAYPGDTAARLVHGFARLLGSALRTPEIPLGTLELLTPRDREEQLGAFQRPATPFARNRTVHELVTQEAARAPEAPAVVFRDGSLTYRMLEARANAIAARLRALGVGNESCVALRAGRSLDLIPAILGIMKAGGTYLPIDPSEPAERTVLMLEDAKVRVLLVDASLRDAQPRGPWTVETLEHALEAPAAPLPPGGTTGASAAYVIYTSGSTGRPKGVVVEHVSLVNYLSWVNEELLGGRIDWIPSLSRMSFDASMKQLLAPLLRGAAVWLLPDDILKDPVALLSEVAMRQRVAINCVPALWHAILDHLERTPGHPAVKSITHALVGGEALSAQLVKRSCAVLPGLELINLYGPTETTANASFARIRESEPITVGRAVANTRLYVVDEHGTLLPLGVSGELWVGGESVARGYLHDASRTAERFIPDAFSARPGARLYNTGDRARYTPDGRIELLGRVDHQVKIRGFRVEPGEIASVLREHPSVHEAVVVASKDDAGTVGLVAYVEPAPGHTPGVEELRALARAKLPDYMVPASLMVLTALPRHATGKVDYKALPSPSSQSDRAPYEAPRNDVERLLTGLWARVLRVERVGIHDNFFMLGGNSIQSIEANYLANQAGLPLTPRLILQHQTIAELAKAVEGLERKPPAPAAAPAGTPLAQAPAVRPAAAERFRPFPMTDLQQAYWVGRRAVFELGDIGPSSYIELDFQDLDVARLERAWQLLVERHDMLRAVVLPDGQFQVLEAVPPYRIEVLDLGATSAEEQARELDAIRQRMAHQVLRPDTWPLFEVRASRLSGGRVRVHVSRDLLISDVRSSQLLLAELDRLFMDPRTPLPPIGFTFRDYAVALSEPDTAERRAAEAYWRPRLSTLPEPPPLPTLENPRAQGPARFTNRKALLDAQDWARLKDRAARAGMTPSAVLCTAFADVLATWSSASRFTLTLMYSDRRPLHPDVARVVGNFSSTLLLEVDASAATFEARAHALQARLWEDLEHASFNGVRAVRELNALQGGHGRAAIPIVFSSGIPLTAGKASEPAAASHLTSPERLTVAHASVQTPQVMLEAVVHQVGEDLQLFWNAREDRFPPGLLDDMFGAFLAHVRALTGDEAHWRDTRRSRVPDAQLRLLARGNETQGTLAPGLLHEPFLAQARQRPASIAVLAPDRSLTYADLQDRARRVATALRAKGARPGQFVAVVMEKHWAQVVAVLGALQAGTAYIPLDPSQPTERLHYILANAGVRHVLTTASTEARVSWPAGIERLSVDGDTLADVSGEAPSPGIGPESLAYVIYTSGSTGQPKGVMISHRGALNTVIDINERFDVGPGDRVLALSSLGFDLSVYDIFGTLAAGGTLVMPEAAPTPEPGRWLARLIEERVTILNAVPALVELLVEQAEATGARGLGALRLVLMSGDWIPLTLPDRIRALQPSACPISLGGATEASIWSVIYPIGQVDRAWSSIPYGRPLRNQRVHVLDEALEPCPVWARGMIYLAGVGLAEGYLGDEAKTRAAFVRCPRTGERLYRTGDLGRWLPSGDVEILGREDFQVKLQGYRVELAEIEAALAQSSEVAAAAVAAVGEARGARRLVGFVVPAKGVELTPARLTELARTRLPEYMVPATFVLLPSLPLTSNGKIDRKALAAWQVDTRPQLQDAPSPARDALEAALVRIWAGLLGVEVVSIHQGFFALGGNSLLALRLMARIERELGVRLPLSVLFEAPTIAHIASALRREQAAVAWSPLVPFVEGGKAAPFFWVHPVGGGVLCFAELSRHLGEERPVYAFEARGLEGTLAPLERIEAMATLYLEALRKRQPTGPYLLGGWSMGALIALEMAQQLEAQGERTECVVMLDPPAARTLAASSPESPEQLLRMFASDLGRTAGQRLLEDASPGALPAEALFTRFLEEARARGVLPAELGAEQVRRLLGVFSAHIAGLRAYVPRPYRGPVLLLRAAPQGPEDEGVRGWTRLLSALTVQTVPGDHYTMMREPHARTVASVLRSRIATEGRTA
ncbi:amino acid adenylation domain-containing protein [Pyxidicoccus parkwayensis]|uniref:Amino acid adenylation domain-containing protein n=1 Tax=Pyxidicoccus parkwayensis TaxID=2813578 RepID=A0ABX7P6U3_9BACT|nr:non-ribosomal peptide synthetase [Pyxidicoccus parkwaysis]QSQ26197.1 amino acid adenylation domain-containing protein [Pyxidicoccus parkwaysis]